MVKSPNPFVPWEETGIIGRKEQQDEFAGFLDSIAGGSSGILLLRGVPGSGKSMLMRKFRADALKRKMFAPYIKAERNDRIDRFTRELSEELESDIEARSAGGEISPQKAEVFRREKSAGTLRGIIGALERATAPAFPGVVFFIDDVDNARKYGDAMRHLANVASEKRGVAFVLSSTRRVSGLPENAKEVFLGPVSEQEFRDYVAKALKKEPKMGDECIKAIYADAGGNPRLLKQSCWMLYDAVRENEKMITKAHYTANMRNIMGFLSRDWFGRLYSTASSQEKTVLKTIARANAALSVTEVSTQMNKPMGPTATLLLRLEAKGHIMKLERGRYQAFSGFYAKFIRERG